MKTETMITVRDVPASSRFYQALLGAESGHGGDEFEMIMKGGELLLLLHHHDTHNHGGMLDPEQAVGNGVVIWFRSDEFETLVENARKLGVTFREEPVWNPQAHHHECVIEDPDGYQVALCSPQDFS